MYVVRCDCALYSPFHTRILPGFDPKKVKVTGAGVQPQGLLASIPTSFTVDVREAGNADLDISIQASTPLYSSMMSLSSNVLFLLLNNGLPANLVTHWVVS